MLDVARRADVAPGTVANHYGSADALATEVTTRILADLRMPTLDLFDGVERCPTGQSALHEISAYFERGDPWWRVSQRDRGGPGVGRRGGSLLTRNSTFSSGQRWPLPRTRMRSRWSW